MKRVCLAFLSVLILAGSSIPAQAADWPSADVLKAVLDDPRIFNNISFGGKGEITSVTVNGNRYGIAVTIIDHDIRSSCYLNVTVRGQSRDAKGRLRLDLEFEPGACTAGGASVGNGG